MSGNTENQHGSDSQVEDSARKGTPDLETRRRLEDVSVLAVNKTTGDGSESSADMDAMVLERLLRGLEQVERMKAELISDMALLKDRMAGKTKVGKDDKSGSTTDQDEMSGSETDQGDRSGSSTEQGERSGSTKTA